MYDHIDNPLLRAAIAERASVDGDVPEFREGAPPREGFRPAIPVVTDSLNPIMVGLMLEKASSIIDARFQLAFQEAEQTALVLSRPAELPASVPGYEAGDLPEPMVVDPPSGDVLAVIPQDKARYFAWLSLATTQGRTSLAPAIQKELERRLGVSPHSCTPDHEQPDIRWTMTVFGPDDMASDFSTVESAVSYFEDELKSRMPCAFTVMPVANIPARLFGWVVRTGKVERH